MNTTISSKVLDLTDMLSRVTDLKNQIIQLAGDSKESRENLATLLCNGDLEVYALLSAVLYTDLTTPTKIPTKTGDTCKSEKPAITPKKSLFAQTDLPNLPQTATETKVLITDEDDEYEDDDEGFLPESVKESKPTTKKVSDAIDGQRIFSTSDLGAMLTPKVSGYAVNKKLESLHLIEDGGKSRTNTYWIPSTLAIRGGFVYTRGGKPVKEISKGQLNKGYASLFWTKDVLTYLEPNPERIS